MQSTTTCLWFDSQAEEAAKFYISIFPNSSITDIKYFPEGGPKPAGSVLTVQFKLDGLEYLALNGGPHFKFTPAISIIAHCDTQKDVDRIWNQLLEGGLASQCGWLTDKFGLSWQVVPRGLLKLLNSADKVASQRAFGAMLQMVKLDLDVMQKAFDNK